MVDLLLFALIFYGTFLIGMYAFQRRLLYFPDKQMGEPYLYELAATQTHRIATEDGIELTLWDREAREGWPTMLYFHGNRGHLGDRANKFRHFTEAGFGLICVSYRGFGPSGGAPSEKGLYHDARAVFRYALESGLDPSQILIYGESLGTGVAVHLARECRAGALVLEAPYTSVAERAAGRYPYLPARYLTRDKFDSLAKIADVNMPLLVIHGELDETIPVEHGRRILARAKEPKQGIFYPGIHHTDFDLPTLTADVVAFARGCGMVR